MWEMLRRWEFYESNIFYWPLLGNWVFEKRFVIVLFGGFVEIMGYIQILCKAGAG